MEKARSRERGLTKAELKTEEKVGLTTYGREEEKPVREEAEDLDLYWTVFLFGFFFPIKND